MMQKEQMNATEYEAWLSKFEVKKTTDECHTPAAVYEAVKSWVVGEYRLEGRRILRPFYPGGDYEKADYQRGDVVLDNPPFSILTKIIRFYEGTGVDFFLFAPTLTLFNPNARCSIVTAEAVIYANGANVSTSFLTSLDDAKVRTAPELKKAMKEAGLKAEKPPLPRYDYPDSAITAARLGKVSRVDFRVYPGQISAKLRRLDSQKGAKKKFFGGGFLISEKKAAELKAAELKAAELKEAGLKEAGLKGNTKWTLSEREIEIIRGLD